MAGAFKCSRCRSGRAPSRDALSRRVKWRTSTRPPSKPSSSATSKRNDHSRRQEDEATDQHPGRRNRRINRGHFWRAERGPSSRALRKELGRERDPEALPPPELIEGCNQRFVLQ